MKKTLKLPVVTAAAVFLMCLCKAAHAEDAGAASMPFFGFGMIEILLIALLLTIPWLAAIIDIVKSEFKGNDKIIMFLLVLAVPLAGMIIYFVIGKKMKVKT